MISTHKGWQDAMHQKGGVVITKGGWSVGSLLVLGNRLLEVNEVDVSAMNHNELGDLLQKSSSSVIRLVVSRLVPMEGLTTPIATSPMDPKWSSLKHKVSPPKALDGLTEVAELKDKCRR